MKRILVCLLLSLCVLCSLCVTVSAEGGASDEAVPAASETVRALAAVDAPEEEDLAAPETAAPAGTTDKYGDMGGAFSPARLALAGQMVLVGMGLIFLALAVLWGVLVIFRKVMYDAPMKKAAKENAKKAADKPEPAVNPAPVPAPAADDGAVVAAITAAIAAAIASDEALSAEFKGGFRVVSFKKKNGGAAWNR